MIEFHGAAKKKDAYWAEMPTLSVSWLSPLANALIALSGLVAERSPAQTGNIMICFSNQARRREHNL